MWHGEDDFLWRPAGKIDGQRICSCCQTIINHKNAIKHMTFKTIYLVDNSVKLQFTGKQSDLVLPMAKVPKNRPCTEELKSQEEFLPTGCFHGLTHICYLEGAYVPSFLEGGGDCRVKRGCRILPVKKHLSIQKLEKQPNLHSKWQVKPEVLGKEGQESEETGKQRKSALN